MEEEEVEVIRWRGLGGWIGLDVLVTMGTGFAIGWFLGGAGKRQVRSLVGGLVGMIVGLLVEGGLVMVRMSAMDQGIPRNEKGVGDKKERKVDLREGVGLKEGEEGGHVKKQ